MSEIIMVLLIVAAVFVIAAVNHTHKKETRKAGKDLESYLDQLIKKYRIVPRFRKKLIHQLVMVDEASRKLIVVHHKDNEFSHEILSMDAINSMKAITIKQVLPLDDGSRKTEIITTQVGVEILFGEPEKEIFLVCYDRRDQRILQMTEMETEVRELQQAISRYRLPKLMSVR